MKKANQTLSEWVLQAQIKSPVTETYINSKLFCIYPGKLKFQSGSKEWYRFRCSIICTYLFLKEMEDKMLLNYVVLCAILNVHG